MDHHARVLSWSVHHAGLKDSSQLQFREFWARSLELEESLGLKPDLIAVNGKGYNSNTIVQFEEGLRELERNDFQRIDSVSLYSSEADTLDFAFYWRSLISISISKILGTHLYVGLARHVIEKMERNTQELIRPLVTFVNPLYGYAYISSADDGPFGYSAGFIHTPGDIVLAEEKQEAIRKWANNKELVSQGKLRDLYQFNLVSGIHLNQRVGGISLKDWINADATRGRLTQYMKELFLWTVGADSYHGVRSVLNENNLLIAYDSRVCPTTFL